LSFLTEITKTLGVDGRRAFFMRTRNKRTIAPVLRIATARERASATKREGLGDFCGKEKR